MAALELARVRVKDGAEADFLAERPAMLAALRERFPGVRDAYLGNLGDGVWIDVVVWDTREQAEAAAREVFDHPEIAGWFRHIDEVIAMEHADVDEVTHAASARL